MISCLDIFYALSRTVVLSLDLPDLSRSTRLAESFTDIPGSFPSSLPVGSTRNGPKPAPQEA